MNSGATPLDLVDETTVERHLLTRGLPDPDLMIRTSGEKRVRQRTRVTVEHVKHASRKLRGQTNV